ncbi:MAG: LysM peptidoglycan-binding domain-containing protein [Kiritimatiellae bacterium]|nr:LysM peptidoglycan-binding domain-containing protein [Kiritimatiellia bacterium]
MIPGFRDVLPAAAPLARRALRAAPAFAAGAAAAVLLLALAGAFSPTGPALYARDADGRLAADAFRKARAALSAGDADAAGALYRDLAVAQPLNPAARLMLGIHLQDLARDPFGAIAEYEAFLRLAPESEKAPLVRERTRACELEIARRFAPAVAAAGAPAAAAGAEGGGGAPERVRALEEALSEARAEAASAREALAETAADRDGWKRRHDGLQKQLDALKNAGSSTRGPRDDLTARFDRLSTAAGDLPSGPAVQPRRLPAPPVSAPDVSGPAVRPGEAMTYEVRPGDTLTQIAQRAYGDASRWAEIKDANPSKVGADGSVRVGDVLRIPR